MSYKVLLKLVQQFGGVTNVNVYRDTTESTQCMTVAGIIMSKMSFDQVS